MSGLHSTGRGGAGNIGKDDHSYTDGGIVHEGVYGEHKNPEYSAGRGGAGNITHSPQIKPADGKRPATPGQSGLDKQVSEDYVPETNLRQAHDTSYHVGRGGQGNAHVGSGTNTPTTAEGAHGKHTTGENKEGFVQKVEDKVKNILHKH